jgi:multidrug efflux pump subunit AcrA (membrane-fusion protein)
MLGSMKSEESFYAQLLDGDNPQTPPVGLPPALADLAKNRASLLEENHLLHAQSLFSSDGIALAPDQLKLFNEAEKDRKERLKQAELKAQSAEEDLASATNQLEQSQRLLVNSREVLDSFSKLVQKGGISRVDLLAREAQVIQSETQVKRLEGMILSLKIEIARAHEEATNTNTAYRKEAFSRLNENSKKIAEIESTLTKVRLTNSQRISEIESRLAGSSVSLAHHEITSPADGIVFEIVSSKPGTVLGPKDTVLKIVPTEELIAKVDITNRDIGFIHLGLGCQVEVASFPAREYGRIEGTLFFIGSDVLPPTQAKPFYSFPAKIELSRQNLTVRGVAVPLQSGMAVSANIKIRNRRVINLFLYFLLGPLDKMQEVR